MLWELFLFFSMKLFPRSKALSQNVWGSSGTVSGSWHLTPALVVLRRHLTNPKNSEDLSICGQ